MIDELWRDIKGFDGKYQASNRGNIRSTNGVMKLTPNEKGYLRVRLYYSKYKCKWYRVNRLIADTFIDNPLSLPQVDHIDGNRMNNNVENLEWVTNKENTTRAIKRRIQTHNKRANFY